MEEFINHFQEYLIMVLIGALFFKETLVSFVRARLGLQKEETTPAWGERLTQYANHDTTERLDRLIEMEEKEHHAADSMRELVKEGNGYLREMKEYGVRLRKD